MKIAQAILDKLTEEAKASTRLRMNMGLRNGAEDSSQRMLNALEPGTVLPIHRHLGSSETDGDLRMLIVEKDRWHSLECLESGSVLFESKDGAYRPLGEGEIFKKI